MCKSEIKIYFNFNITQYEITGYTAIKTIPDKPKTGVVFISRVFFSMITPAFETPKYNRLLPVHLSEHDIRILSMIFLHNLTLFVHSKHI